ncbi:low-CO2 inducible [Chlorella sorokiniana]|uniref:Low-CO2 inducible n=1 Tax=Chlorella sorokiniana TaxID=3076 RepID=A0A2P6TLT7_CHLSO|nr:low-CO2 inducible [Chlorella sorokiniana]|eukprot:PRW45249.1 low-CO2 inducible [Chlorella sorokiniana]
MAPCAPLLAASSCQAAGPRCSSSGSQNGVCSVRRHLRVASAARLQPIRAAATDAAAAAATADANGSHQPVRPDTPAASLLNAFDGLDSGGSKQLRDFCEIAYLSGRTKVVQDHFPMALGVDDFLHRMEIALFAYGFNGDNSIAMVNMCRDEVTNTLKHKFDGIFGSAFNTNGLGGVLTCGVSGVAAGLSHAPISRSSGKERYVFFSMPHISIDAKGRVGAISRPGRPGVGCACGALAKALVDIQRDGLTSNCKIPGVHDARDPEYTILKQRLARRLRYEGADDDKVRALSLVDMTVVAERTITDDLEYLISQTVDPSKADYAVVTGVQIHNWGAKFDDNSPNLEYVAPTSVYVVVNGEKTYLDLHSMPSLTPRQVQMLASMGSGGAYEVRASPGAVQSSVCNSGGCGTVREIDPPYLYNSRDASRRERERADCYVSLLEDEGLHPQVACAWPSWQSGLRAGAPHRDERDTSVVIDHTFESDEELDAMWEMLQAKYVMPPSSSLPAYQRQGSILNEPASSEQHQPGSQGGLSPGGAAAQGAPVESVSNTSAPASLSTDVASSAAAAPAEPVPDRPQPNTGILSRLLSKVAAAKKQRRQE